MRIPERCCVACRKRSDKAGLIRLVKDHDGNAIIDIRQREDGRGAYICRNTECIETARKRHSIDRALKCHTSDDLYDRLKELTNEQT